MSARKNRRAVMAELILLANPTAVSVHTPDVSLSVTFDSVAELKSWLHLAGLNDPDMLVGERQGTTDDGRPYRSMNAYPTWHGWEFYASAREYIDSGTTLDLGDRRAACRAGGGLMTDRTFTHPSVLAGIAAGAGWADPTMNPADIDWTGRRAAAAIPFPLVDGRPVNPFAPTGIRYGRNELGHWGEAQAADAIVTASDSHGGRWLLLIKRDDNHGWALPGGHVDPGEDPTAAAFRELAEETGLTADPADPWVTTLPARYVPDPRASDEAWMVTTPVRIDLGHGWRVLPDVTGSDDARCAAWVPAVDYPCLVRHLADIYGGVVFAAHRDLLADILDH